MGEIVFSKYSRDRGAAFQIRTSILQDKGQRWVEKVPLTPAAVPHIERLVTSKERLARQFSATRLRICPCEQRGEAARFEFIEGAPLSEKLYELVKRGDERGAIDFCSGYAGLLRSGSGLHGFVKSDGFCRLYGDLDLSDGLTAYDYSNVDFILENVIEAEDGPTLLDYEWCFDFAVPLEYILYRSLYITFEKWGREEFFDKTVCPALGILSKDIRDFQGMEASFRRYVYEGASRIEDHYDRIRGENYSFSALLEGAKNTQCHAQVFYDHGQGFSEEDSDRFSFPYGQDYELVVPVTAGLKALRIDPSEEKTFVTVKKCCALGPGGVQDIKPGTNGCALEGGYLFDTVDAQLYFPPLPPGAQTIKTVLNVMRLTPDTAEEIGRYYYTARQSCEQLECEKEQLGREKGQLTREKEQLGQEKEQLTREKAELEQGKLQLANELGVERQRLSDAEERSADIRRQYELLQTEFAARQAYLKEHRFKAAAKALLGLLWRA